MPLGRTLTKFLALFAVTVNGLFLCFWVRGFFVADIIAYRSRAATLWSVAISNGEALFSYSSQTDRCCIANVPGELVYGSRNPLSFSKFVFHLDLWQRPPQRNHGDMVPSPERYGTRVWMAGFQWETAWRATGPTPPEIARARQTPPDGQFVVVPFWFIQLLLAVLVTRFVVAFAKSRARQRNGRCVECGYDLRETPTRCPECGTDVAAVGKPRSTAQHVL